MKNLTEKQIQDLGFEMVESYHHDQFTTNRYQKGVLEVEFTYYGLNLDTIDLTIQEINCLPINATELKHLDKIFNKKQ